MGSAPGGVCAGLRPADTPEKLEAALERNERWLVSKIKEGYKIYDIGEIGNASPFYAREKAVLARLGITPIPLPGY